MVVRAITVLVMAIAMAVVMIGAFLMASTFVTGEKRRRDIEVDSLICTLLVTLFVLTNLIVMSTILFGVDMRIAWMVELAFLLGVLGVFRKRIFEKVTYILVDIKIVIGCCCSG